MENYWTRSGQRKNILSFTKDFYDLGYHEKVPLILPLLQDPLLHEITINRIVLALLQHSNKVISAEYPCKGVRKLSAKAKAADEAYLYELSYA